MARPIPIFSPSSLLMLHSCVLTPSAGFNVLRNRDYPRYHSLKSIVFLSDLFQVSVSTKHVPHPCALCLAAWLVHERDVAVYVHRLGGEEFSHLHGGGDSQGNGEEGGVGSGKLKVVSRGPNPAQQLMKYFVRARTQCQAKAFASFPVPALAILRP